MISRNVSKEIINLLQEFPAVGILGPRQIGKTTLAEAIAHSIKASTIYLDLENPAELMKLSEPQNYFEHHKGSLVILDEIQRAPEIFPILRGVIDKRRREGFRTGQFLILGSASLDLLKQSSETLAGRIAYKELGGITAIEIDQIEDSNIDSLWLRGGFPDSYLAASDAASLRWRTNFITTYLERDIPMLGTRIPAVTLRRLWTMLAHNQGGQANFAQLGAGLDISVVTAKRYIELLEDVLLVRTLRPWASNTGKRLVKSPKVYIRDSGLTHALLNLKTIDDVLAHPVAGISWEGFVIENIMQCLPGGATAWYYRTGAGAEIDLVIELNASTKYAIEIKRSSAPKLSKGFYLACADINATKRCVVYAGTERFELGQKTTAISLRDMMREITSLNS